MSNSKASTCQICAREIKTKRGYIAHHGYRRPGGGWQTASCFGARWKPYEASSDAIPRAIIRTREYIAGEKAKLANFQALPPWQLSIDGRPGHPPITRNRPDAFSGKGARGLYCKHNSYEAIFWNYVHETRRNIFESENGVEFLKQRLADWQAPQ